MPGSMDHHCMTLERKRYQVATPFPVHVRVIDMIVVEYLRESGHTVEIYVNQGRRAR